QYFHFNDEGRRLCAPEFLASYIIDRFSGERRYFSFGASTEENGKVLNEGLASFKEGFGAGGFCNDRSEEHTSELQSRENLVCRLHPSSPLFPYTTLFRSQYFHFNDEGRRLCAPEFLASYIIDRFSGERRYFSFGASTEENGKVLNEGLASFKEGFGAGGFCND